MSCEARGGGLNFTNYSLRLVDSCWMIFTVLLWTPVGASAQQSVTASAKVIAWANANIGNYNKYVDYARHGAKPQVPVPPMVDPPCHLCGDKTQTQGESQVAAWVQQSQEPERTYIKALVEMDRQIELVGGANSDILTSAAQKALRQFEDDAGFMSDIGKLADRVLNGKAIPMAQKYDKEPKQAYAGIKFLIIVSKSAALTGGSSSKSSEDQVMDLVKEWEYSIANKIDSDIVSGHKYNLCPVYAEIFRSVVLLGGEEPRDMDQYQQKLQKLQDLVKFDVNLNLQASINGSDGSRMHATWTGKAKFRLNLDLANSCYTPVFDNGGQMVVNVTNWDSFGIEKHSGGSISQIPILLTSSHSYIVHLSSPQLNLCDPEPIFQMPLSNLDIPQEVVTAKGHASNASFFAPFLAVVIIPNEVNSAPTNAVTGAAPSLPGGGSSSQNSGSSGMDQAKHAIEAHKGDTNWLMSPAGQAAIAKLQQQALQTAQTRMASAGVVVPNANSFANLAQSFASAHLPWSNGSTQPVNKTLHMSKDGSDFTLTINVQQAR